MPKLLVVIALSWLSQDEQEWSSVIGKREIPRESWVATHTAAPILCMMNAQCPLLLKFENGMITGKDSFTEDIHTFNLYNSNMNFFIAKTLISR